MVLSYGEVGDLLDEIAEDFPPAFFFPPYENFLFPLCFL